MDFSPYFEHFFLFLEIFEDYIWIFFGVPIIVLFGIYFSIRSRFMQIVKFPEILYTFVRYMRVHDTKSGAVHPLKAFFASVGGCIGIANIVAVLTAVQIGGPGALFWIWVTAMFGMLLKYAEVYLGLRYRIVGGDEGYLGGPMYYLKHVSPYSILPSLFCFLLCIYGVEFYQFSVVTESLSNNLQIPEFVIVAIVLVLVLFAVFGGVRRVGSISSVIIPVFVVLYMGMGLWVMVQNYAQIPTVLKQVFVQAFTGSGAVGGFIGSTFIMALSQGVRKGCYSGDIGVGYASIIHSESSTQVPERQASLVIFDIFLDTFVVCTISIFLVLLTDVWHEPLDASMLVQKALDKYFPYMNFFIPLFIFLLGYSTINAYFVVGIKCAEYLSPQYGKKIYYVYGTVVLIIFSFVHTVHAQTVMTITGGLILLINCYGIFSLRKEVSFALPPDPLLESTHQENHSSDS